MLDINTMQALLKNVRYKPSWEFRIYQGRWHGSHLNIKAKVMNAYDTKEMVDLDIHVNIPPMETREQFLNWLLWRIIVAEIHEAREFFWYDREPFSDPHADNDDRDL